MESLDYDENHATSIGVVGFIPRERSLVLLSEPLATLAPGPRGRVLSVLARADAPLTGRAVASLTRPRASLRGVQLALDDLTAHGLVHRRLAGNAHQYTLNREHLAAGAVLTLVDARRVLLERIGALVNGWALPPTAVWLFGSTARGDDDLSSDIDLLIVRPDEIDPDIEAWQEQLTDLAERIVAWSGNVGEVLELSLSEVAIAAARGDRLIDDLRRDAVDVAGTPSRRLLRVRSPR